MGLSLSEVKRNDSVLVYNSIKNVWKRVKVEPGTSEYIEVESGEDYPEERIMKLKKNTRVEYSQRYNVSACGEFLDPKKNPELFFYFIMGRTPSEKEAGCITTDIRFFSKYYSQFLSRKTKRGKSQSLQDRSRQDEVTKRLYEGGKKQGGLKSLALESQSSLSPNPSLKIKRAISPIGFSGYFRGPNYKDEKSRDTQKKSTNAFGMGLRHEGRFKESSKGRIRSPMDLIKRKVAGQEELDQESDWRGGAAKYLERMRKQSVEKENDRSVVNNARHGLSRNSQLKSMSKDEWFREISNLNYTNYERGVTVEYAKKRDGEKFKEHKKSIVDNVYAAYNKNFGESLEFGKEERDSGGRMPGNGGIGSAEEMQRGSGVTYLEDNGYESGLLDTVRDD